MPCTLGWGVLHEEVTAGVDQLEIHAHELRPVALNEQRSHPAVQLARGEKPRELRQAPLAVGAYACVGIGEEARAGAREVGGGRAKAPFDVQRELSGKGHSFGRRCTLHLMEGQPVRDLEAAHLFGRMSCVPAHEAGGATVGPGHIPQGRDSSVAAADGHWLSVGQDLHEVEDPVILRFSAGDDAGPDEGRKEGFARAQACRDTLASQAPQDRQASLPRQTLHDVRVGSVEAHEQDARFTRPPPAARAGQERAGEKATEGKAHGCPEA